MNRQAEQHPQQLDAVTVSAGLPEAAVDDPVETAINVNLPAGMVLSTERKAQEKTVEEVARHLNLSASTIRALETDQAEGLPELTYVRGYIRSYARLLGLDPETVLSAYSADFGNDGRASFGELPQGLTDRDFQVSGRRSAWMKWSLIGGILLTLLYWWSPTFIQQWFDDNARERPNRAEQVGVIVGGNQGASALEQANSEANLVAGGNQNNVFQEQPSIATQSAATNSLGAITQASVAENDNAAASINLVTGSETDPVLEAPPAITSGNVLVLSFASACWVDARDSQNNRLAYQTVVGGGELRLVSDQGMTVFLGNAEGVTAVLNGEAFDLAEFRQGVYANFTIDATTDTAP